MSQPAQIEQTNEATANPAGVFDLSSAEGVNESERMLMRLCRKSFLSLWAHANLHTAQDMRDGRGSAKEFADVLVGRSRYAEESPAAAPRIILHLHPLNAEGLILQYFVRTNQHDKHLDRPL